MRVHGGLVKKVWMLLLAISCGGSDIDTSDRAQVDAVPCECTEKGCGTQTECTNGDPNECFADGAYVENACGPFYEACEEQTGCDETGDCSRCATIYSDCVGCFRSGLGGDVNGTCVNGDMFRGC